MIQKIKDSKGESIAESLVSILIVALASILFAGMVTASSRIIDGSTEWMTRYYAAVSAINKHEQLEGSVEEQKDVPINFTIDIAEKQTQETVTAFINDKLGADIVSYIKDDN